MAFFVRFVLRLLEVMECESFKRLYYLNNMKKIFLIIVFCFINCAVAQSKFPEGELVSIIKLIATPENYYDKIITIQGYLSLKFEDEGVFLNENDANYSISQNAIGIYGLRKFDKNYIIVSGVFKKNISINNTIISKGAFAGYITDILYVEKISNP